MYPIFHVLLLLLYIISYYGHESDRSIHSLHRVLTLVHLNTLLLSYLEMC
jgi:hypothetical protein